MIRLIILVLGIFLIWLLFYSNFSKQRRVVISLLAVTACVLGLWLEQRGESPRAGRMAVSELVQCGVTGTHSYRTNFDIKFCLQNNSPAATVKRVALDFTALKCSQGDCREVQVVSRELACDLSPAARISLTENINFKLVDPLDKTIVWKVQPTSVKAIF